MSPLAIVHVIRTHDESVEKVAQLLRKCTSDVVQIGFGPVNWLLISEIFPLEVRSSAVAIAVS
jgi:hypothetical protein